MGGTLNQPQPQDMDGWMRWVERRLLTQERRSPTFEVQRQLGAGIGKYALQVLDWNGEDAWYNGTFWSDVGAFNSPDDTKQWIGQVFAASGVGGIQQVYVIDSVVLGNQRSFTFTPGGVPTFSAWASL